MIGDRATHDAAADNDDASGTWNAGCGHRFRCLPKERVGTGERLFTVSI
jgi:hypothetical protein